ncbi:hypothetical protein acdb102_22650 [Acidothermaceae bacterium B102]|nr:hypothetical protein acdb102_22650 [Acidothermaceae bacterium B102]
MLRQLASVTEAIALTAIALLLLGGYFGDNGWQAPTLAAAACGAIVAWMGRLWQRGIAVVAAFVFVGGLLTAGALLLPSALRNGTAPASFLKSVLDAPLYGWSRMLTVGVPAATSAALLALPVALAWAAALMAATLSLGGRKVLAPLLPSFLLFVVTLMLSASHTGARLGLTTAFLALALLGAFGRANAAANATGADLAPGSDDEPAEAAVQAEVRRFGARAIPRVQLSGPTLGVPIIAAIGALSIAVAGALPANGDPFSPRPAQPPNVDTVQMLNPLVSLKSVLDVRPTKPIFTVRITGAPPAHDALRLRVASLGDFDGVTWATTGHFTHPAAHLPPPGGGPLRGDKISVEVTVGDLSGSLLPTTGQLLTLNADGAEVDPPTGVAIVPSRDSLNGYHYDFTALLPVAAAVPLDALPDAADSHTPTVLPPGLPSIVTTVIDAKTAQGGYYSKLKALESYLYSLPVDRNHPPQESYAAVAALVSSGSNQKPGFAEQHAAAFAVMARRLQLPVRVDVGYEIPARDVTGGVIKVTTGEAHAWDEVFFRGYGWVPFEPTNDDNAAPIQLPASQDQIAQANSGSTTIGGNTTTTGPVSRHTGLPLWQRAGIGILIALALAALIIVLAKSRRRHRRRTAATTSRQVLGAWAEAMDQLIEASLAPPPSLSPEEIGTLVSDRIGPEAGAVLTRLSPLVDQAAFAALAVDAESARLAWLYEQQLKQELLRHHPFPTSWRRQVDPRPLFRRPGQARRRSVPKRARQQPEAPDAGAGR